MTALTIAPAQQIFPLPFRDFIVVSAERSGLSSYENVDRTVAMRSLLKMAGVAFIEAAGIYKGQREACFVLPGMPLDKARALGILFDQESILVVADTVAHYAYAEGRRGAPMASWRVVNPDVDPCLSVPGFPPIQFL